MGKEEERVRYALATPWAVEQVRVGEALCVGQGVCCLKRGARTGLDAHRKTGSHRSKGVREKGVPRTGACTFGAL